MHVTDDDYPIEAECPLQRVEDVAEPLRTDVEGHAGRVLIHQWYR